MKKNSLEKLFNPEEGRRRDWQPMILPIPESVLNTAIHKALSTEDTSNQRLKQLVVHVREGFMLAKQFGFNLNKRKALQAIL